MKYIRNNKLSAATFGIILIALCTLIFACESPDPTGPAASSRITLTSTRNSMPADGATTCTITAYVLDRNGFAETDAPIYWSTTCGTLSEATGTISGGYASVTLTAPNYGCTAVVTADAVHAQKNIEIPVYDYGVDLDADPATIPADGSSTSTMIAYVFDSNGNPVEDGTTVDFGTNAGTLSAYSSTTSGGWAYVTLTSSTTPGTATVTARVGNATTFAFVTFSSTDVGSITLTASPSSGIPANGYNSSSIKAVVRKLDNTPLIGGSVYFSTNWGVLSTFQTTTDSLGIARVVLTGSYSQIDKTAVVKAESGTASATVNVGFKKYFGTPSPAPTNQPTYSPTPTPVNTSTPTFTPTNTPTSTPTPTPEQSKTQTPTPSALPAFY